MNIHSAVKDAEGRTENWGVAAIGADAVGQYLTSTIPLLYHAGTGQHSNGIRQGLLRRGWVENPDHDSPLFHFKWAVKCADIDHGNLASGQLVNHFARAACITTKVGQRVSYDPIQTQAPQFSGHPIPIW
jgi:hypothetical protein